MRATRDDVHLRASAEADLVVAGWLDRFLGDGDIGTREAAAVLGELGGALWRRGARGDSPWTRRGLPAETDAIADALYAEVRRDAAAANWPDPEASGQIAMRRLALACERAVVDLHKAGNRWWEQPRVPRGDPDGGQWTEMGGGGGGRTSSHTGPHSGLGPDNAVGPNLIGSGGDDRLGSLPARRALRLRQLEQNRHFRSLTRNLTMDAAREIAQALGYDVKDMSPEIRALLEFGAPRSEDKLRSPKKSSEVYQDKDHWITVHGAAGEGMHWHRGIEEAQIGYGEIKNSDVNVWQNYYRIPSLVHERITSEYARRQWFTDGLPLRIWLRGKPKRTHIIFARRYLRKYLILKY